jgi:hypothetical protein
MRVDQNVRSASAGIMNQIKPEKLKLIQLFNACRDRSGLKLEAVMARVQTRLDFEVTLPFFQNRFTSRLETMYDIEPGLALAVVAAFTERLLLHERCTPQEAVEFAWLARLPKNRFAELRALFPTPEERGEFDRALRISFIGVMDGEMIQHAVSLPPPRAEFNPNFLQELQPPSGAVKLSDPLYVERDVDQRMKLEIVKAGTTINIRAPRQTGKTSLLMRGLHLARGQGHRVVFCDLQAVDWDNIASLEKFLQYLAQFVFSELQLDVREVDHAWHSSPLPSTYKLTSLMHRILDQLRAPMVLALDEADRLLQTNLHTDFFALLRSWHNRRAYVEQWNRLNIVTVISTEPYLLIANPGQSPFNVGLELALWDFSHEQVLDLNQRHGSPVWDEDFPQLMQLLNGHPYLTRQALYTLVSEGLTWDELNRTAIDDQGPFGGHLRHHHRLLSDEPVLKEALKEIIRNGRYPNDVALYRLLSAGLIKGSGEDYVCRCGLYDRYFRHRLNL